MIVIVVVIGRVMVMVVQFVRMANSMTAVATSPDILQALEAFIRPRISMKLKIKLILFAVPCNMFK